MLKMPSFKYIFFFSQLGAQCCLFLRCPVFFFPCPYATNCVKSEELQLDNILKVEQID